MDKIDFVNLSKDIVIEFESEGNNNKSFMKEIIEYANEELDNTLDKLGELDDDYLKIKEFIVNNSRKLYLIEKIRRALTFAGAKQSLVKDILLDLNKKYSLKPEYRL